MAETQLAPEFDASDLVAVLMAEVEKALALIDRPMKSPEAAAPEADPLAEAA